MLVVDDSGVAIFTAVHSDLCRMVDIRIPGRFPIDIILKRTVALYKYLSFWRASEGIENATNTAALRAHHNLACLDGAGGGTDRVVVAG